MNTFSFGLLLAGLAMPSFAQEVPSLQLDPKQMLELARAMNAQQAAAPVPGKPVETKHIQFQYEATLYDESRFLIQTAELTVSFDMDAAPDVRNDRMIRNVAYTLEVKAGGNVSSTAYSMGTLGPDSPVDFFPPDPKWWARNYAYSEESFQKNLTEFFIEIPVAIQLDAAGSVLQSAIKRLDDGRAFGAKGLLKLYPYCSRDLKTCHAGELTGISYDAWGLGWNNRIYPDFRLLSDAAFSMVK